MPIHTVGIDIAKSVFHLVTLDETGCITVKKKFSRAQLLVYTANLQAGVIGMEACCGAHFLARALVCQGHNVRLMPAEYVRPYVNRIRTTSSMLKRSVRLWYDRPCASFR